VKKLLKIVSWIGGGLLALILLLAITSQTQFFRDRLRSAALSQLDSLLTGRAYLGEITGNLVTGFQIDSLSLSIDDVNVVSAARVDIGYDLFSLPGKMLAVNRITLVRPSINILKDRHGRWNLSRMIHRPPPEASAPPDTTSALPDWKLNLRALRIRDGTVTILDSLALTEESESVEFVNYRNLVLSDVNVLMSARLLGDYRAVEVSELTFASRQPEIRVSRFSCSARVTGQEIVVDALSLVTTHSDLRLSASLEGVDLFGGITLAKLRHSPVHASLKMKAVDLAELRRLLPAVHFLDGSVSGTLEVDGEFGAMEIRRLDLTDGPTALFLKGRLKNLHAPENLDLDVKVAESTVDPGSLRTLLPGLQLPDFGAVGPVSVNLDFAGRPLDFTTRFTLRSRAGTVSSPGVAMVIGGTPGLKYDAAISFNDLDLEPVLQDPMFASTLNGAVTVAGSGVSLRSLNATLDVRVDSSDFHDLPIPRARLFVRSGESEVHGTLLFSAGDMYGDLTASLADKPGSLPSYSLQGEVRSINLERFLHNPAYNSDLTMRLDTHGNGFTWKDLTAEAVLDFSSSRFGEYTIDSGSVRLIVDRLEPPAKQLTFESNVIDGVVTGTFDLPYLIKMLSYELRNVQSELARKLTPIDSMLIAPPDRRELKKREAELMAAAQPIDAQFGVLMKNLEPLSILSGLKTFNGVGTITGSVWGDFRSLSVQTDLDLAEFFYGTEEGGVLVENGSLTLEASQITPENLLSNAVVQLGVKAGSVHVNRLELDTLEGELDLANSRVQSWGNVSLDRSIRLSLGATGEVLGDVASIGIDRFGFRHKDYEWWAEPGASVEVNRSGLRLQGLTLARERERLAVEGSVAAGGHWDAHVKGSRLDLQALRYVLAKNDEKSASRRQLFTGELSLSVDAGGTFAEPWYVASVAADDVTFREAQLGKVSGNFHYRDSSLAVHVETRSRMKDTTAMPDLSVDGTIPLNLGLAGVEGSRVTDATMDLSLRAQGFQLAVFDPFLAAFDGFGGLLTCDVRIGGTLRNPRYAGPLTISDCSFLFKPNNIEYLLNGSFQASGDRIGVVKAELRNVPEDVGTTGPGVMSITGDFGFRNFRPGDFRFSMGGNLLVVKESTRRSSLEVSGNLFVEIGQKGLFLTGEVDHSLLKGQLQIRNSTLVFPPTQSQAAEESALSVPVISINDTVKAIQQKRRTAADRYFVSKTPDGPDTALQEGETSVSFVDGMRYDLEIESSGGTTEIEMIFNSLTSEKLVAAIDGKFTIVGEKSRWFGELTISRAYYNFLKRFDAEGKIRYTGDFLNPELDIKATYKGTRVIQDSTGTRDERVVVTFTITGTREKPKIDYGMTIDDADYATYPYPSLISKDVQTDALQFILYGTFPLTTAQRGEAQANLERTLGASVVTGATSLLTGAISEYLRAQTGFISSVEFSYGGPGKPLSESAEIRLSGSLWNGYWRYGGKILEDPLGNANFSLMYSFGSIFGDARLRNLMFELERRVESASLQTTELRRINSARIFYRLSF
jgi:TamB, inner membrane protein subunit of TAM complex